MEAKRNGIVPRTVVFRLLRPAKLNLTTDILLGEVYSIFKITIFNRFRQLLPYPGRQVQKKERKGKKQRNKKKSVTT